VPEESSPHSEPRLLPTSVVGSYPQPDWLIDRGRLASRLPPRIRALELWRGAPLADLENELGPPDEDMVAEALASLDSIDAKQPKPSTRHAVEC